HRTGRSGRAPGHGGSRGQDDDPELSVPKAERPRPAFGTESWSRALGSALELVLPEQAAADDRLLDLAGALTDEQERRLAHEPLDLVLLGVAVAAVDAERLGGHLGAILAGQGLGHAGLDVVALAGVLEPRGVD